MEFLGKGPFVSNPLGHARECFCRIPSSEPLKRLESCFRILESDLEACCSSRILHGGYGVAEVVAEGAELPVERQIAEFVEQSIIDEIQEATGHHFDIAVPRFWTGAQSFDAKGGYMEALRPTKSEIRQSAEDMQGDIGAGPGAAQKTQQWFIVLRSHCTRFVS